MVKRFWGFFILLVSMVNAEDPRLFIGINLGASLTSISPVKITGVTPLTKILDGVTPATGAYNKEAYLETSDITKHHVTVIPTIGMSFPISGSTVFEGAVSIDATEKEYLISNQVKTNKVLAEITRDIGITGALMMRLSKQYSVGPLIEGHIFTSRTPLYTGATKKDYHNADVGFQTTYTFHRYFTLGLVCTASFDQNYKVKDPDQTSTGQNDMTLDVKQVRTAISLRLTPI